MACHSFVRGSAWIWEESQVSMGLPLISIRRWIYEDTGLFLRDELLAVIREHGGVTAAGGLQQDGRLQVGGHVKTIHRPLHSQEVKLEDGTAAFASDGAPSDCVALALLGYINEKVDLVVSGINCISI